MSSRSDIALSVRGLSKAYKIAHNEKRSTTIAEAMMHKLRHPFREVETETFWALNDVNFEVNKGEVVGIIGRNGAGKSTLLKILSRITEPTKGEIDLFGRVGSLLEVGTGFHPELTGRENIYLNGGILGMRRSEIDRQFDAMVDFAEVERFLDTPVKRYSSGMYVRLAFAVAAHLNPEILVVDEVLAVGDSEFQKKCLGKMEDIAGTGRTILFVSHDMSSILRLCSRGLLMQQGQLVMNGPVQDVVDQYLATHSDQTEELNLSCEARPREGLHNAEIVGASSPDSGAGPWKVPFGIDFEVRIRVLLRSASPQLEIGPSVFALGGLEIASTLSTHVLDKQNWKPGLYEFRVRYGGLRLMPGRYKVNVGVRSGFGFEDYLADAFTFEVVPSELAGEFKVATFKGVLVPDVAYEVEEVGSAKPASASI